MLIKIDTQSSIGKVYQVTGGINRFLNNDFFIIQCFGRPLGNTVLCTEKYKIRECINMQHEKDIVIFSISFFEVDEELHSWLRIANCRGRNVYLFTFEKNKMWYADEIVS